ncbi:MAG: tRNA glutamyl-Q(34) synthetase GluQRS [Ghiorsea sp.]|nr:tRNA glutamyl-Q(34) synthetase GluQRS [Ghiorsea sp.]
MLKRTRFAPSPSGLLHLGNAYSALSCQAWAKQHDALLLLRVEDIDFTRCKPKHTQQMLNDLDWLGIKFSDVSFQQQRLALYEQALQQLIELGVLYPCFCTRKQILETLDAQQASPSRQGQGLSYHCLDPYPKTCKQLDSAQRQQKMLTTAYAWRLDCEAVAQEIGQHGAWFDIDGAAHHFDIFRDVGDVIIGRKDIHFSYHLCVVVDDAAQGITHVIRGEDLRRSTPVHRILQRLLAYDSLQYLHHKLITNQEGNRLAKSKASPTLKALRDEGQTAKQVRLSLDF